MIKFIPWLTLKNNKELKPKWIDNKVKRCLQQKKHTTENTYFIYYYYHNIIIITVYFNLFTIQLME